MSVCLSVYLPICLSVCRPIHPHLDDSSLMSNAVVQVGGSCKGGNFTLLCAHCILKIQNPNPHFQWCSPAVFPKTSRMILANFSMVWNSPWCPIYLGDPTTNTEHHPKVRISEFGEFLHAGTHQSECRYWLEAWKPVCRGSFPGRWVGVNPLRFSRKISTGKHWVLCGFYHQTYRQFLMKPILGPKGGPKFWWDAKEIPLHQKTGISHFFGGYYDWDGTSSKDFSTACCSIAAHFKNQLIRFLAGKTEPYSSNFSWFFIQFLMFWLVKSVSASSSDLFIEISSSSPCFEPKVQRR